MRFHDAVLGATHNSFGLPLAAQLEAGIVGYELDVHRDGGRLRIGHDRPGDEVHPDNPVDLAGCLRVLAAPAGLVVVTLDCKDDLTVARSFADWNPAALNAALHDAFGARLLTSAALGAADWPDVEDLDGRVLAVLSGDKGGRDGYRRDGGIAPAAAMNADGWVVEAHESGRGELWYWTGRASDAGVTWLRHGRVGPGRRATVALADDGTVTIRTRRGRLGADGEIAWSPGEAEPPPPAADPRIAVRAEADETLVYATARGRGRIRYEQVAFVEAQWSVRFGIERVTDQRFVAADAGSAERDLWCREQHARGAIVRRWNFGARDVGTDPPPNLPATNEPHAGWYRAYLAGR